MKKGEDDGLVLALLGLPTGSIVNLDGQTVLLKRDDFIGFHSVPVPAPDTSDLGVASTTNLHSLHAVFVRAGEREREKRDKSNATNSSKGSDSAMAATTVGFILCWNDTSSDDQQWLSQHQAFIRQYDPRTEEISSDRIVDEETVALNLRHQLMNHSPQLAHRLVAYSQLVPPPANDKWNRLTNYISPRLLYKRGIRHGEKIVPGSYENGSNSSDVADRQRDDNKLSSTAATSVNDGMSVLYPAIPVVQRPNKSQSRDTNGRSNSDAAFAACRHDGTRRFLKAMTPEQRTAFALAANPATSALEHVLAKDYDHAEELLLGDLQLAYILFVHLHCYASFVHWRDLLTMLTLLSRVERDGMEQRFDSLYTHLLAVVADQVGSHEEEQSFLEEIESTGDNFLVQALYDLVTSARSIINDKRSTTSDAFARNVARLEAVLYEKFPIHATDDENPDCLDSAIASAQMIVDEPVAYDSGDEEDDDGPVIVSSDEVEASLGRSNQLTLQYETQRLRQNGPMDDVSVGGITQSEGDNIRHRYPFLVAAMDVYTEDILMTCARVLDEAVDVTLVREAAAYLEEVEASRGFCR